MLPYFPVLPPGLEPGTTDPKSVMMSISPQELAVTFAGPYKLLYYTLGESTPAY